MDNVLEAMAFIKKAKETGEVPGDNMEPLLEYYNERMKSGIEILEANFPSDKDQEDFVISVAASAALLVGQENPMALMLAGVLMEMAIHTIKITLGIARDEGWFESPV